MAIKQRKPNTTKASKEAIEAFGDAAEQRPSQAEAPAQPQKKSPPETWPADTPKTLLIRYPDPELPTHLAELAKLEERSQHSAAVRALRRGIEELRKEAK